MLLLGIDILAKVKSILFRFATAMRIEILTLDHIAANIGAYLGIILGRGLNRAVLQRFNCALESFQSDLHLNPLHGSF